eukprot:TRINITY_DN1872_c0_g1_i1.p1 TRINITY_DN1872_c0_g1~~TRINITY_DN1872_c0_g1_i1.p1  ORF type:complete len:154 (+),score=40.97 TRINITY_DN1872_c0_g1_i1:43-462(+)
MSSLVESIIQLTKRVVTKNSFLRNLVVLDQLETRGKLVGTDANGNKYYEDNNDAVITGRRRWVDYSAGFAYDASQVPPEWHSWLHHMSDIPGHKVSPPKFQTPHRQNLTGTPDSYHPRDVYRKTLEPPTPSGSVWNPQE